ncbi:methionyl-tRNA formyltransferase [Candidatus Omnitrophota bacterium]
MKIIFFGSSDFAVSALEALKDKEDVQLVITQPDKKKGRSLKVSPTAVKKTAIELGMEIFQPNNVNTEDAIEHLNGFKADLFVVVSFGQILRKELLDLPKLYPLNVHSSLLPKYRGAAPINWAIANGETHSGVSVIRMNEKMDEGDIVLKRIVSIGKDEDAIHLSRKLSLEGAKVLLESIELIRNKKIVFTKQDDAQATYVPKLKKEDGFIDWGLSAEEIYNRIRAFVPWPGCFTRWEGKILKVWQALPETLSVCKEEKGTVLECSDKGILVTTGDKKALRIKELQVEGKRRMKVSEFIVGHKEMKPGVRL